MTEKFGYDKITIGERHIDIDGVKLDGWKIAQGVTINNGDPNDCGPTLTISIYADEINMADEAKAHAKKNGTHVTEIWGDREAICIRTMTGTTCRHVYRDGTPAEGNCYTAEPKTDHAAEAMQRAREGE